MWQPILDVPSTAFHSLPLPSTAFHCLPQVWQPILDVHLLAAPAHLNLQSSLKFAQLCQKSRRRALAVQTLSSCGAPSISRSPPAIRRWSSARRSIAATAAALAASDARRPKPLLERLGSSMASLSNGASDRSATSALLHDPDEYDSMPLRVWFGFASFLWHDGEKQGALRCMQRLLEKHGGDAAASQAGSQAASSAFDAPSASDSASAFTAASSERSRAERTLAAKAWLKLGEWQRHLSSDERRHAAKSKATKDESIAALLRHYSAAATLNPSSYQAC